MKEVFRILAHATAVLGILFAIALFIGFVFAERSVRRYYVEAPFPRNTVYGVTCAVAETRYGFGNRVYCSTDAARVTAYVAAANARLQQEAGR